MPIIDAERKFILTKITKKALENAFTALLEERPLSKITVADIASKAGVNRHTFYYHFRNIDDMIVYSVKDTVDRFYGEESDNDEFDGFFSFLEYIYHNRQHIYSIMHSSSRDCFMRAFCDSIYLAVAKIADSKQIKASERDYVVRFYVHGLSGIFSDWIDGGMEDSPERVAEIITRIIESDFTLPEEDL